MTPKKPRPETMTVVYVGPSPAVEARWGAGFVHFPNGEPVEVPTDLAESLLEQNTFTTPHKEAK
jgi:hypothetical protein